MSNSTGKRKATRTNTRPQQITKKKIFECKQNCMRKSIHGAKEKEKHDIYCKKEERQSKKREERINDDDGNNNNGTNINDINTQEDETNEKWHI